MDLSSCPFCSRSVPYLELERHANSHFDDDEIVKDTEFGPANQLLTVEIGCSKDIGGCQKNVKTDIPSYDGRTSSDVEEEISHLTCLQVKSDFYKMEDGLMSLLKKRLESESGKSTCILSGYIDHFQSMEDEDVGWGCGWRNVQMLSSHLLMERREVREVLFGGSGFVPDIPSLQRWLEIAWKRGFDEVGAEHFDGKIYGLSSWIGTTECVALFRSFGLRARIVDFCPKELGPLFLSVPGSKPGSQAIRGTNRNKRPAVQMSGPMDKYLARRKLSVPEAEFSAETSSSHIQCKNILDGDNKGLEDSFKVTEGQQVLIDWVWEYFSEKSSMKTCNSSVSISTRTPLYFQHDGHSRTIIGIQVVHQSTGIQKFNLLVLDPVHRTAALERSLKRNAGWQKLMKRGVHTLKKPQYQLCYIDPGIADGEEIEQLKKIDTVYIEF